MTPDYRFRPIGRLDNLCPSCLTEFHQRPKRKTRCKACGAYVYARTRPFDNSSVLLSEADTVELEKDWEMHYKIMKDERQPLSAQWMAIIEQARHSGPHHDPEIERMAQAGFVVMQAAALKDIAPRDAKDQFLALISDPTIRDEVDRRIWQLGVKYVG